MDHGTLHSIQMATGCTRSRKRRLLLFFHYDPSLGALAARQTVSTLPSGFTGTNFCSEILSAANRLHNSVAIFAVGPEGKLNRSGEALTEGDYPNQFNFDSDGNLLYVRNQRRDQVTLFRAERKTGLLAFTGAISARWQPHVHHVPP